MHYTASAFAYRSKPRPSNVAPRAWLLLGNCKGDNNQVMALAEAVGLRFEVKRMTYTALRFIPPLRKRLTILARKAREQIKPPWPELVIGSGYASVPIARFIREQSGGRTRLIHIGNPRTRIDDFDLQITTPQYSREDAPNLVELPFPIGNPAQNKVPNFQERLWLRDHPRPLRLVAVGGPARHWQLDDTVLEHALGRIDQKSPGGSMVIAVSNRTPATTRHRLSELAERFGASVVEHFPSFGTLLGCSDEIYVTADSVSMISEAILSGKPVGVIPIRRSLRGQVTHWLWERPFRRVSYPDFPNFWTMIRRRGLVGTVELPVSSEVCDSVERAAEAVRSLMAPGNAFDGGTS